MAGRNRKFPHLLAKDIDLWLRFIDANPNRFKEYEYDIRVGAGRDPGEECPDEIRRMSRDLSQRRIDVIGLSVDSITIIEITCSAGLRAIGQVIAYPILYQLTHPQAPPMHTLIVAESIQTDMQVVFDRLNVPVEIYPE